MALARPGKPAARASVKVSSGRCGSGSRTTPAAERRGVRLLPAALLVILACAVPTAAPAACGFSPGNSRVLSTALALAPQGMVPPAGEIEVLVSLDGYGTLRDAAPLRPGDPRLDAAAVTAARASQYVPAVDRCGPVPSHIIFRAFFADAPEVRPAASPVDVHAVAPVSQYTDPPLHAIAMPTPYPRAFAIAPRDPQPAAVRPRAEGIPLLRELTRPPSRSALTVARGEREGLYQDAADAFSAALILHRNPNVFRWGTDERIVRMTMHQTAGREGAFAVMAYRFSGTGSYAIAQAATYAVRGLLVDYPTARCAIRPPAGAAGAEAVDITCVRPGFTEPIYLRLAHAGVRAYLLVAAPAAPSDLPLAHRFLGSLRISGVNAKLPAFVAAPPAPVALS